MKTCIRFFFVSAAVLLLSATGLTAQENSGGSTLVLTLEKALEIAYEQSPTIVRSRRSLEQIEVQIVRLKASLKPQFNVSLTPFTYDRSYNFDPYSSQTYLHESMSASGSIGFSQKVKWLGGTLNLSENMTWQDSKNESSGTSNTSFGQRFSLRYSQPLFKYNEIKHEIRQNELNLESAKITYATTKLNLEQTITNEFYNLYNEMQNLEDARFNYKQSKTNFEITKSKVEAGLVMESELLDTEVSLLNDENSLASSEENFINSLNNFKITLGLPLEQEIVIEPNVALTPVIINPDLAVEYGMKQNLEFRQTEISIENAYMNLTVTKAQDKFSGDLSLTAGFAGNDSKFEGIFKHLQSSQGVSLTLSIPIWDWGVRKANIKNQQLGVELQEYNFEQEKVQYGLEIRNLCREINRLYKSTELTKRSLENSERNFLVHTENFNNGNMTAYDYQQRQKTLSDQRKSHTNAIINYKKQLLQLKIKTLWDFEKQQSIFPTDLLK